MKVCVIVFSPSGHTLEVAEMMKTAMEKDGMCVQLLNVTKSEMVFNKNAVKDFLLKEVKEHDLLCIGGPVYAGHLENNVKELIRALPQPDEKWGKLVIPFVTYGGVHSSIAMQEAGELLFSRNRINIMGVKLASYHTLTKTLPFEVNKGKPDNGEKIVIQEMIQRLKSIIHANEAKDVRNSFYYAKPIERMIFKVLSQDFLHKKYRTVEIDSGKCSQCGICEKKCPVNLIKKSNDEYIVNNTQNCLLCGECYHSCKSKAINFEYIEKAGAYLSKNRNKLEHPQSAVYPQ